MWPFNRVKSAKKKQAEEKKTDLIPTGILHTVVPVEFKDIQWDSEHPLFKNKIYLTN